MMITMLGMTLIFIIIIIKSIYLFVCLFIVVVNIIALL